MPPSTVPWIGTMMTPPGGCAAARAAAAPSPARTHSRASTVRAFTPRSTELGARCYAEASSSATTPRTTLPSASPLSCGMTTFITAPWFRPSAGSCASAARTTARISSGDFCCGQVRLQNVSLARLLVDELGPAGRAELLDRVAALLHELLHHRELVGFRQVGSGLDAAVVERGHDAAQRVQAQLIARTHRVLHVRADTVFDAQRPWWIRTCTRTVRGSAETRNGTYEDCCTAPAAST